MVAEELQSIGMKNNGHSIDTVNAGARHKAYIDVGAGHRVGLVSAGLIGVSGGQLSSGFIFSELCQSNRGATCKGGFLRFCD